MLLIEVLRVLCYVCNYDFSGYGRSTASAIFIGVYEPTKEKLLKIIHENLSALAHIVLLEELLLLLCVPTELLSKGYKQVKSNHPQLLSVLSLLTRDLKVFMRRMQRRMTESVRFPL